MRHVNLVRIPFIVTRASLMAVAIALAATAQATGTHGPASTTARATGTPASTTARATGTLTPTMARATGTHALDLTTAQAAGTSRVRDEGSLRFVTSYGSELIDEGRVSGTIPGSARVEFTYNGSPQVSARFTIHGAGGTIGGQAHAKLSNPSTLTPSFRGNLTITGGSGRYAHAHGSGELFGVFHRHGYGLVMQALGTLRY